MLIKMKRFFLFQCGRKGCEYVDHCFDCAKKNKKQKLDVQ